MHPLALAENLRILTAQITAYRFARHNQIIDERREMRIMALEIKGLKGKALKARANIDALNAAYDKFNEDASAHAADVEGLTSQVTSMQDDLQFAVTTLGNSTSESEKLDEKPKEAPPTPPTLPPANDLTVASPAVGEQPATFQEH